MMTRIGTRKLHYLIKPTLDKLGIRCGRDSLFAILKYEGLLVKKKKNYMNLVTKKETIGKGWKFFVSDSASIIRGTNAVGFKYKRTGNDFAHAAAVVVVSPRGKITRYLTGIYFLPFDFKMAIIEASKGTSAPTINKIMQYCFSYDPVGKAYVLNVTKISGTLILFFASFFFLFLMLKPKRKI